MAIEFASGNANIHIHFIFIPNNDVIGHIVIAFKNGESLYIFNFISPKGSKHKNKHSG